MQPVPEFGGLTAAVTPSKPSTITLRDEYNWEHFPYKVRFTFEQRHLTLSFKVGTGWTVAPTPAEVMTGYFDDVIGAREADGWEEYASMFGYEWQDDPAVARRAKQAYESCLKYEERLRALFGEHFEHAERVFTELRNPYAMLSESTAYVMRRSLTTAPDNEQDRALWRLQTVLEGYYDASLPIEDPGQPVRDLLTDVLHFCDARGINYSEQAGAARRMVTEERHDWGLA
jgi:hypothetical protein